MNISIERHFFVHLIMVFVLVFASAAHADGSNPQSGYDEAYKDAQEYQVADDALVHAYQQLLASLPNGGTRYLAQGHLAQRVRCHPAIGGRRRPVITGPETGGAKHLQ
jgi:hypothetical protein